MKYSFITLFLLLFNSVGFTQFGTADTTNEMSGHVQSHDMVDLDNDGDLDLLEVGYEGIYWYENEGEESFGAPTTILTAIEGRDGLFTEDIDADGWEDFTAHYKNGADDIIISWFKNNGDGTFSETVITTLPPGANYGSYVFFDDNADGYFDLYHTLPGDGVFKHVGSAGGVFGAEVIVDDAVYNYHNIFYTDFDADGDEDLIYCTQDPITKMRFSENLGDGTYAASVIAVTDLGDRTEIAAFADMDLDGDMDWVLGYGWEYHQLEYFENLGGTLADGHSLLETSSCEVAIGDMDLDGYPDIVAGAGKYRHKWLKNNADGTFEEGVLFPIDIYEGTGWLEELAQIHLYDLDEDGDLDVYTEIVFGTFYFVEYENYFISTSYQASGTIFADLNENGVKDMGEIGVDFPTVTSDPAPETSYINADGEYFVAFEYGVVETYSISADLPENWAFSTVTAYDTLVDGLDILDSLDFGIYPTVLTDSISTFLNGAWPRCNDTINYWIKTYNKGTTRPSGLIDLELDDSLTFISANVMPDSIVEQHVYWHYDSIMWYDDFLLIAQVQTPDFLSEGDTVFSNVSTTVEEDGATLFTATNELEQIITCAYDPNDKIGFPFGVDEPGYISDEVERIEYTVRFQNTGSDTAFTVVIEDTLDMNLNWETFTPLSSSHDMAIEIGDDGLVSFIFENIMLPDSTTNGPLSQGFVSYTVDLETALPLGTTLENTAYIYFDLNPAVVTNTTKHTPINCENILSKASLNDSICPDGTFTGAVDRELIPSSAEFQWTVDGEVYTGDDFIFSPDEAGEYTVDVMASTAFCELATSFTVTALEEIPVSVLPLVSVCDNDSVLVFGTYRTTSGLYADTLSSAYGCDSIINQTVEILDTYSAELPAVSVCAGDSVLVFGNYQTSAAIYTNTLTATTGCDSVIYQSLEVLAAPVVAFDPLGTTLCENAGLVNLTGSPVGGLFSGLGVEDDNFNPVLAGEGEYTIYYTYENAEGCSGTDSVSFEVVDCLSLTASDLERVIIYPNPFSNFTQIDFGKPLEGNHTLFVYDESGKIVLQFNQISTQIITISKGELSNGLYLVSLVETTKGVEVMNTKLVVE